MIKKISRAQEIEEQLKKDGKISYLDKPEHIKAILAMNKEMEEVKRLYKVKERKSEISAANLFLTA